MAFGPSSGTARNGASERERESFCDCPRSGTEDDFMTASLPPQGENSPKDSRIEPLNVPQKETPQPGPLPLGRGEGQPSTVHLLRGVQGEGEAQVRPALPKPGP